MDTWSCTLEVTTPMALAGADQQRAELRPNTFKNMMRWWWRAGRGRLDREREARLFGNLGRGEVKGNSGSFRPRLYPLNALAESSIQFDDLKERDGINLDGLDYFGFYLDPPGPARGVIEPGARFQWRMIPDYHLGSGDMRALWASLWLLVWFGGLGSRSRRGFGGMRVLEADATDELDLIFSGATPGDLKSFIEKNLRVARQWLNADAPPETAPPDPQPPSYTAIVPGWTRIGVHDVLVRESWNDPPRSWSDALAVVGQNMAIKETQDGNPVGFRNRFPEKEYYQIKDYLWPENNSRAEPPDIVERAAFGLPLTVYYSSLKKEKSEVLLDRALRARGVHNAADVARQIAYMGGNRGARINAMTQHGIGGQEAYKILEKARQLSTIRITPTGSMERRASPLFIRVCRLSDNSFVPLFILMKARFLPDGVRLLLKREEDGRSAVADSPPLGILDEFLERLNDSSGYFGRLLEIDLQ